MDNRYSNLEPMSLSQEGFEQVKEFVLEQAARTHTILEQYLVFPPPTKEGEVIFSPASLKEFAAVPFGDAGLIWQPTGRTLADMLEEFWRDEIDNGNT